MFNSIGCWYTRGRGLFESLFSCCQPSDGLIEIIELMKYLSLCVGVELSINKFLDASKEIENYFLQRQLLLSVIKPEQAIKDVSQD